MTVTEAPPDTDEATADLPEGWDAAASSGEPGGFVGTLMSTDHKTVGRLYLGFALLFGVVSLLLWALVGVEAFDPDTIDVFDDAASLAQARSLAMVSLAFLVVAPLLLGLATAVVPLQLGSPAIAFPRAAATGFWSWLLGSGILVVSYAVDGGFGAPADATESDAVALSLAALVLVVLGLLLTSVCVATSVFALRPEGMTLDRVPLLAWSSLVSAFLWIVTLPVLIAVLVLAYVDLRGRPPVYTGLEDQLMDRIDWVFLQPQVYVFAIMALGVIGDIVPVAVRVRQRRYGAMLVAIGLFGMLSFGAYALSFFDRPGLDVTEEFVYLAMGIAMAVPLLVYLGGVADTFRFGRSNIGVPTPALLGALVALLLLALGVVTGVLRAIEPLDLLGTNGVGPAGVAGMNLVLLGALAAGVAGISHWGPKLTGRLLPGGLFSLLSLLLFVGALVVAVPQLITGFLDADETDAIDALAVASGIGSILVAAVALGLFVVSLLHEMREGEAAGDDPFTGHTLEWATTSPPPPGNFDAPVPEVHSERPLLDHTEEDV